MEGQLRILRVAGRGDVRDELDLGLLEKSRKLRHLELRNIVPKGLGKDFLQNLAVLKIAQNKGELLSDNEGTGLTISLEGMNNLAVLKLHRVKMSKNSLEALGTRKHLSVLSLCFVEGPTFLPSDFDKLSCLRHLRLADVNLTALSDLFAELPVLEFLLLRNLMLEQLPQSFGNLSSLATLEIWECNKLASLPESFGNLSSLATLQIRKCNKLASLPEAFGNLSSLATLEIWDCKELASLPESLGNLSSLATLKILGCDKLASHSGSSPPGQVLNVLALTSS
jgi:Leucine-rich repeat (LRR) protein